jgi:hypothetical protein
VKVDNRSRAEVNLIAEASQARSRDNYRESHGLLVQVDGLSTVLIILLGVHGDLSQVSKRRDVRDRVRGQQVQEQVESNGASG